MSKWRACKRRDFLRKLCALDFKGPYRGTKHEFMIFENYRLTIPSNAEYSIPQLKFMLQEADEILGRKIDLEVWERL